MLPLRNFQKSNIIGFKVPKVTNFKWDTGYIFRLVDCAHPGLHSDPNLQKKSTVFEIFEAKILAPWKTLQENNVTDSVTEMARITVLSILPFWPLQYYQLSFKVKIPVASLRYPVWSKRHLHKGFINFSLSPKLK